MNAERAVGKGWIPFGAIAVATACVAGAAYERFGGGFYWLNQSLLAAAAVPPILGIAWSLWRFGRRGWRRTLAAMGVYLLAIGIIALMGSESRAANLRKNRAYLERLAGIAASYTTRHGAAPDRFDQAVDEENRRSGLILPTRGDADGHALSYARFGPRDFTLASPKAGLRITYRGGAVTMTAGTPGGPGKVAR